METICAIATAPGGAIGVVRVSGPEAIGKVSALFRSASGRRLTDCPDRQMMFGRIVDERGETVDEVLAVCFRAPHSYTGEDSVEISCHGSAYILGKVIDLLIEQGCRAAQPGEYTKRAFLNGKMDLCQAEAVADIVSARSRAAHRLAVNQMRGGVSKALNDLRHQLLNVASLLELEIDFSDHEDVEFADRSELDRLSAETENSIARLTASFRVGNAIKNGLPVAIVGETNAGKSTLLNLLVGEERAIVSPVHGTTRDAVEDVVIMDGFSLRLIDTAGIRQTDDEVEAMGIERTYRKIDAAEVVLYVVDATATDAQAGKLSADIISRCADKQLIVVVNKIDLLPGSTWQGTLPQLPADARVVAISAKQEIGIDRLRSAIIEAAGLSELSPTEVIITNARHHQALTEALDAIRRVRSGLSAGLSADLLSEDLRLCNQALGEIVTGGSITTTEVLGSIFGRFCIGK